jgi:tetratricopeptide (TPR) repeat protein
MRSGLNMQMLRDRSANFITLLFVAASLSPCFAGEKNARILERADGYFKAGEYDKAKVEYLNLLRLGQDVTAFQQLGFIWWEQGTPLRAAPFLLKVRELSPKNLGARAKLALVLKELGLMAEARKEALAVLQEDPGNLEVVIVLAETSQSKEEINGTAKYLEQFPQKNSAAFHLAKASLALKNGDLATDLATATEEVQRALEADPKSTRAHSAMGLIYLLRKDQEHAASEFKTAAELAPVRSTERIKYAEFEAAKGAVDEARKSLETVTKQAPDYLPAWRDLAQFDFAQKRYDHALSLLENIFSRDPDNPDARLLESEVWLAKGDAAKAATILEKLDLVYPKNPVVKYNLAQSYLVTRNLTRAAATLEQAISARPDYPEASLLLAQVTLRLGKPEAVVAPLQDLLKKHPDLLDGRLLLANTYQASGRMDDAANLFREQIKITPQLPQAHFFLGVILRQQKKTDEARQEFEKAAELAPDNPSPIDELVELDLTEKRYDAAMRRVQLELQKKPDSAPGHFTESKVYAAQQDWPRAEAALQKTIEIDPKYGPAYNLLVSIYLAEKKLSQAISQLEAKLDKNPNDAQALLLAARIYEETKDYSKARDAYEKLITLYPDAVIGLNNLAYLYLERFNQADKAYELAQKAHSLQPTDGMVADTLGWTLYKRGDYQQALSFIEEAVSKQPNDPEVQYHLGMTNYMMGRADQARAALETAANATTDFSGKEEAQRRLALLKQASGGTAGLSTTGLEALLKQNPNDLFVLSRLAEAHANQGEPAKAAPLYEQALKLNPKLLSAAIKLAELYAGPLRNPDKALNFAKMARELAPTDPQVAIVLGRTAFQAGNFTWAYSLLQESARQGQDDPAVSHDLALVSYALGKVPEARQLMQRCLDAKPDAAQSEDAKRFLTMTALEQPSPQVVAAEQEIQDALKAQPDYVPALMAEAAARLQRSDTKSAAAAYSQVLQKYPDFAPAAKRLAAIYAANPDDISKAYDLAMKARKTLPDDPELARTLARVSFARKDFAYAIQLFQQSAAKQPLLADDLYYLGIAEMEAKQDAKGRATLQDALAAGLQDPLAGEAKKRLGDQRPK